MKRTPEPEARPWFILRVSPNMERRVVEALTDKKLTVYAPVEKYVPANTWRARTRPLMPGYIFADLPDAEALEEAKGNKAVREIMCREGKYLQVPAIFVGTMILLEGWKAFDRTWRKTGTRRRNRRRGRKGTVYESRWEHGTRVRIRTAGEDHPLEGFEATVFRTAREMRIEVLVMLFGRATPVEVEEGWLEDVV